MREEVLLPIKLLAQPSAELLWLIGLIPTSTSSRMSASKKCSVGMYLVGSWLAS